MLRKITGSLFLGLAAAAAAELTVTADRPNARYKPGERAVFKVVCKSEEPVTLAGIFSQDGGKVIRRFEFDPKQQSEFSETLKEPGFLRLTVTEKGKNLSAGKKRPAVFGVAFDPEQIRPGAPEPADFWDFWQGEIAAAEKIPLDPRIEKLPAYCTEKWNCYSVSFAAPGGRVYGTLTLPKVSHKVPALVIVPGAGPGSAVPVRGLFNNRIAVLNMTVHDFGDEIFAGGNKKIAEYYKKLQAKGVYSKSNAHDRKAYFFHRVILGINRAVDYLAGRPEIDPARIGIQGSSQGGMLALVVGTINPHVSVVAANVPAMCDHHAGRQNRAPGWPRLVSSQVKGSDACAHYYDTVNFCRHLNKPVRVAVGFADGTCSPGTVYAAWNSIPAADKKIADEIGMGHSVGPGFKAAQKWQFEMLSKNDKEKK